jgi:hypothetical protein
MLRKGPGRSFKIPIVHGSSHDRIAGGDWDARKPIVATDGQSLNTLNVELQPGWDS